MRGTAAGPIRAHSHRSFKRCRRTLPACLRLWLARLDRLAGALAGLDAGAEDAASILAGHSWAALTGSILGFPLGKPVEVTIGAGITRSTGAV